jgi:hypothetical protein
MTWQLDHEHASRIETVDTLLVDLPTTRPHQLSMTTMRGQTLLIAQHPDVHNERPSTGTKRP